MIERLVTYNGRHFLKCNRKNTMFRFFMGAEGEGSGLIVPHSLPRPANIHVI